MTSISTLLRHNVAYLEQARRLIGHLSDEAFVETREPIYSSAIGDHLRHILEHYQAFVDGFSGGRIDYDGRARDRAMASSRTRAKEVISNLVDVLSAVPDSDHAVDVRLDGGSDHEDEDPWSTSTLKRELQYLQAHTVHHYALIAFILQLQGTPPPKEFGVAPSTIRHRRKAAAAPES